MRICGGGDGVEKGAFSREELFQGGISKRDFLKYGEAFPRGTFRGEVEDVGLRREISRSNTACICLSIYHLSSIHQPFTPS